MTENEKSMTELADEAGLKTYDTAIPQGWVDKILEQTRLMGEEKYPYGFVWGYDKSPIWGEPIPLTEYAKALAKELAIEPR